MQSTIVRSAARSWPAVIGSAAPANAIAAAFAARSPSPASSLAKIAARARPIRPASSAARTAGSRDRFLARPSSRPAGVELGDGGEPGAVLPGGQPARGPQHPGQLAAGQPGEPAVGHVAAEPVLPVLLPGQLGDPAAHHWQWSGLVSADRRPSPVARACKYGRPVTSWCAIR